jgi:hypothetical protein
MVEADKPKETGERKCPECGSTNIHLSGAGVGDAMATAEGGKISPVRRFLAKCNEKECGKDFWYRSG